MYNRVIFMGRLTRDPELRTTQNGTAMCRFAIAVDRGYSKGQDKQTDFFEVICWRNTADFVSKYFRKGQMIHIEGTMQNNNYTDQSGVKHYSMNVNAEHVAFCGDKSRSGAADQQQNQPYSAADRPQGQQYAPPPQYQQPYNGQYPPPQGGNGYY